MQTTTNPIRKTSHGQNKENQKRAENLNTIGEMIQRAKKERADKRHCGNEMKTKTATTLVLKHIERKTADALPGEPRRDRRISKSTEQGALRQTGGPN